MESLIGKTISRYRIVEKLGQGGMGVVYKAEDSSLKRMVALKFLPGDLDDNPERKIRFLREAQTAAALDHPNIATVYDVFEDEHYAFISMAFVEGVTLKQRIHAGPIDVHTALNIAIQIASGLAAAHQKGIVHRDIKSANIILKPDGQVKITDFGLAKLKGDSGITKSGAQIGTAAYMAPEQIQGKPADHRSDIFSLGITMYEMLAGSFPFKGENDQAVMFSILYDTPAPLGTHLPGLPASLNRVVQKMLAKDPGQRYQDASEIVEALTRIREQELSGVSAPAERLPVPRESSAPGESPTPAPSSNQSGLILPKLGFISFKKAAVLGGLILALIAAGYFLFIHRTSIPFAERDWILVVDFKNETGESVFDRSLNTALTVSIGQSRYVNVFPRRRVRETLQRMKLDVNRTLDESLAREVALREGVAVMLAPAISRIGNRYALTAVLSDPQSGKIFKSEITYADSTNEVLDALDRLTRKIRRSLGETLAAIARRSKPLVHVTTRSLEALRQYGVADQLKRQANFKEARSYYENALNIDSTFTTARAALGILHIEQAPYEKGFNRQVGIAMLKKAVLRADSLTDVEKYGILAYYAQFVENDLQKAADYHRTLLAIYPDLSNVHNNLAIVYRDLGEYDKAAQEFKTAIRLDPTLMLAYNGLNILHIYYTGEIDSARVWAKRQIRINPDHYWAHHNLAWVYLGQDSLEKAEKALKRCLRLRPDNILLLYRLGYTYRMRKKYSEAVEVFLRIARMHKDEFDGYYQAGLVYQTAGEDGAAREEFRRFYRANTAWFRNRPKNADYFVNQALYYSRMGDAEKSRFLADKVVQMDSTRYFQQAQLQAVLGNKQRAIDFLEKAIAHGFYNFIWMKIHPDFVGLKNEPRFQALLSKHLK